MRNCAIIHPLHLELETALCIEGPLRGTYSMQAEHSDHQRRPVSTIPSLLHNLPWHRAKKAENRQQEITAILLQSRKILHR